MAAPSGLVLGVRPEDVELGGTAKKDQPLLPAVIDVVEPLGADTLVFATMAGHPMAVQVRSDLRPQPDRSVRLSFSLDRSHVFDAATGRRLLTGRAQGT